MAPTVKFKHEYTTTLRAGFIGCGDHALRNIYPTFEYAPIELIAICDLNLERAQQCKKTLSLDCKIYTNHQEMLQKEALDVVFIVTGVGPDKKPLYPKLAIDCLRAGSHAWIEKPPASSSEEVLQMMAVSKETGKYIGVGLKKMFFPVSQKAKAIIESPEFGQTTCITARYPENLPSEENRGSTEKMVRFLDHIVHPHSLLKLLGGNLKSIHVNRHDTKGSAIVSLKFTSGAIGSLLLSAGQGPASHFERTEVIGQGASLIIENNLRITYYRKAGKHMGPYGRVGNYYSQFEQEDATLQWEPEFSLGCLYNKGLFLLGYAPEIIHFTEALLNNEPPTLGTLEDALEMLKIYEAYLLADGMEHDI